MCSTGDEKNKQFRHSQIYSINLQKNFSGFNLKPKGLRLALLRGDVVSKEAKSVHLLVVGNKVDCERLRKKYRKSRAGSGIDGQDKGIERGKLGRKERDTL